MAIGLGVAEEVRFSWRSVELDCRALRWGYAGAPAWTLL